MKIIICEGIDKLDESFVARSEEILPKWRSDKMFRYKHLRGRVQCALGWMMVEYGMRSMEGSYNKGGGMEWGYNEHGKPYLKDKDIFFNISHCKTAVAVIVADAEVGIDIEEMRYRESLEKYVLSEEEIAELNKGEELKEESFTRIWTKKEAVFKYYGTGITHDIKNVLKCCDVNIYSKRIGEKYVSVATEKELIDIEKSIEIIRLPELLDFVGSFEKC